ncbi:MAG: hypothetical protein MJ052_02870, partial [Sphaerochaetaceae bacterium]|nr:hypothetical protein [Sphaerochaetaceae bacterium]
VDIAYKYGSDVIISTTFNSPEGSDFTNPVTALMESFDLGKNRESVREILNHKDALWIRCDVENFNMTQYDAVEELASRGYESAKTVSGNMSVYSNGGVDSSLSEVRSEYTEVIPQILERTSRFNHSPARKMSSYAAIVGRSFDTRLRDDMTLGLGYAFAKGDFSFDVTAGMAARAANDDRYTVVRQAANRDARVPSYESKPYISAPQVAFHTDYFFAENRFHVAADVAYRLNRGFWLNQQFEYRWKNLTAFENFETDFKTTHMRIGAEYLLLKMLRFEGGFRTDSFKQFWGYVGAEGNFSFRPVKLYAKVRTDIGIKTCTVLSAEIDAWYVFDKASVVSDIRLGLYGKVDHNFGYRKDEADGYGKSTAFEMGFDGRLVLSMSGLRQYPFRLRVGYNFADKKVVWSSKINF